MTIPELTFWIDEWYKVSSHVSKFAKYANCHKIEKILGWFEIGFEANKDDFSMKKDLYCL